jgi:hypothetical protein
MFFNQRASAGITWGVVPAVAAAALLAGCGGSQPQMAAPGLPQLASAPGQATLSDRSTKCPPQKGAVQVSPCVVHLSPSHPGPIVLTLKMPHGSKGSMREHDQCGTIARIRRSGDTWIVRAGSTSGHCMAHFQYSNNGNKVQWARAHISNSV